MVGKIVGTILLLGPTMAVNIIILLDAVQALRLPDSALFALGLTSPSRYCTLSPMKARI